MPKIHKSSLLFELIVLALIAHTLAGVLPPSNNVRNRRAIDSASINSKSAENDRDIVAAAIANHDQNISDNEHSAKQASQAEGVANATNPTDVDGESESTKAVKSTKLLPAALGNNHASISEHKSSGKLLLNRVESQSQSEEVEGEGEQKAKKGHNTKALVEEDKENAAEKEEKEKEKEENDEEQRDDVSIEQRAFPKLNEEQGELKNSAQAESVFSTANATLHNPLFTMVNSTTQHIKDGLDDIELSQSYDKDAKTAKEANERQQNLRDLENEEAKMITPASPSTKETTESDRQSESAKSYKGNENEKIHNAVNLEDQNGSFMGRAMDAVHSSENKLEDLFGEKSLKEETTTKTNEDHQKNVKQAEGAEGTILNTERTITTSTIEKENDLRRGNARDQGEATGKIGTQTQANPTTLTQQEAMNTATTMNPLQALDPVQPKPHILTAEKRAKFINENSTYTQNMNLPDGSVVWSLASMRMVPKETHHNGTPTPLEASENHQPESRWQTNEILTTERSTMNISDYSEKNLLDWTKVMGMRGEFMETMEKNHLTEGILEEKGADAKESKTDLPLQVLEKIETAGPAENLGGLGANETTQLTTEGISMAKTSNNEQTIPTHTLHGIDTTIITTTPAFANTKILLSSESPLSLDKNDKHGDFSDDGVLALNKAVAELAAAEAKAAAPTPTPTSSTESFNRPKNSERTGVDEQMSVTQESTTTMERQPSDDFNFIITSTTPRALLNVEVETADAATAATAPTTTTTMATSNETTIGTMATITTTAATILTALPVEHSTSTPADVEATKRWDNALTTLKATELKTTTETTPLLSTSIDAGDRNGSVHAVTLEQHLKHEPASVIQTETESETGSIEKNNTWLTVSELTSSEAYGSTTSASVIKSNVNASAESAVNSNANANASASGVTIGGDISATSQQNESTYVATETTTESTHIAATTISTFTYINNTKPLSTSTTNAADLVGTNANAKASEEAQSATVTTTTEVSQIGNEVELETHSTTTTTERTNSAATAAEGTTDTPTATVTTTSKLNSDTGSSAHTIRTETVKTGETETVETTTDSDEPKTSEKSVLHINEPTTTITPSTLTVPITTPATPKQAPTVEPVSYTTTPPAATTLKSDESINEKLTTKSAEHASGSVLANSTTTTTTTIAASATTTATTPVDFIRNHAAQTPAKGSSAHDTESSIETNVIDQVDKTTVKISGETNESRASTNSTITAIEEELTTTETSPTTLPSAFDVNNVTTPAVEQESVVTTTAATTTRAPASSEATSTTSTMANVPAFVVDGGVRPEGPKENHTTTEPPLINLLDDNDESTTSSILTSTATLSTLASQPSTTTSASVGAKPQEVYTVFSTTESSITTSTTTTTSTIDATASTTSTSNSESSSSNTAPVTPLVPKEPTIPVSSSTEPAAIATPTSAYIPTVASTIATFATTTTTILPPTLHAGIGGVGGGGAPTHLPDMINAGMRPNPNAGGETDVNVIIAITVSVIGVVALILLVAFLYLMRKRQKQMSYGQRCRPVSLDAYSLDNVSVLGSVRRKGALRASKRSYGNIAFDDPSLRHNALSASELARFVERRSSIFEEFRDVPQITARADEIPPGCEDKNRYANVIPLPETRVVLQQLGDDDKTEYINANYVRGPKDAPNYYIATQAPLETTVTDFWRMIWEQQSRVIIQATDLYENGIEKCAEYLPPSVTLDNHTTYGDFQVTLKHREVKDKYAISTLMLKNTAENESRELTHYWYKWPETGVPNEEAPIIAMLLEARSSLKGYVNE